ncbi:uncharacterized protein LOC121390720 isoform X2 [Gigantopelta aegis]|uniref:uncharacterized protein LOC121390720 isoform X2 n=1 Tax=Gigantopelta aegis TaxID=1735272 RepID=UPI001B88B2D0|nr:uncharacterized protein LOC121390720 isoform X2 [Gigantopelta aegis]
MLRQTSSAHQNNSDSFSPTNQPESIFGINITQAINGNARRLGVVTAKGTASVQTLFLPDFLKIHKLCKFQHSVTVLKTA